LRRDSKARLSGRAGLCAADLHRLCFHESLYRPLLRIGKPESAGLMTKRRNLMIALGAAIILITTILAIWAPLIAPYDPNDMRLPDRLLIPSHAHILGTDENGCDIFSRMLYGSRASLLVAACVVLTSGLIGLLLGSISGFFGGRVDMIIMRTIDVVYAFP